MRVALFVTCLADEVWPEIAAAAVRLVRDAGCEVGFDPAAIAETGSILILENEGDARLCTTLPRMHGAAVGIEKVFLRLLPRSGTGHGLTTCQSLRTGPRDPARGEGPEEVHAVPLDNGRSRMLRKAVTRQSLACIRCGACRDACPVGFDIPELLLHLRAGIAEDHGDRPPHARRPVEALVFRILARCAHDGRRVARTAALTRAVERGRGPLLRRVPPLARRRRGRVVPRLSPRSYRSRGPELR